MINTDTQETREDQVRPTLLTLPGRGCTVVVEAQEQCDGQPPYVTVLLVDREVVERRYTFDEAAARALATTMLFEQSRRGSAA